MWQSDAIAVQYCKAFLQTHTANSKATRVVLDPQGEVEEGDVESSRPLNTLWKLWKPTMAVADAEILLPIRENPENVELPQVLSRLNRQRPSQISKWTYQGGADEMGLSTALERE